MKKDARPSRPADRQDDDQNRRVDTLLRRMSTSVDWDSSAQPRPRAPSWSLRLGSFDTAALGKLRTFLNFYTDAAGLELQTIAHDDEQIVVRVAGERMQVDRLQRRLDEIYPDARVWLE